MAHFHSAPDTTRCKQRPASHGGYTASRTSQRCSTFRLYTPRPLMMKNMDQLFVRHDMPRLHLAHTRRQHGPQPVRESGTASHCSWATDRDKRYKTVEITASDRRPDRHGLKLDRWTCVWLLGPRCHVRRCMLDSMGDSCDSIISLRRLFLLFAFSAPVHRPIEPASDQPTSPHAVVNALPLRVSAARRKMCERTQTLARGRI